MKKQLHSTPPFLPILSSLGHSARIICSNHGESTFERGWLVKTIHLKAHSQMSGAALRYCSKLCFSPSLQPPLAPHSGLPCVYPTALSVYLALELSEHQSSHRTCNRLSWCIPSSCKKQAPCVQPSSRRSTMVARWRYHVSAILACEPALQGLVAESSPRAPRLGHGHGEQHVACYLLEAR